jgi:hypothetical protein
MERIVVPPPKLGRTDEPGIGAAAGAKDIAGQRAVLTAQRDLEGTGDCLLDRASALAIKVSVVDAPAFRSWGCIIQRAQSGLQVGLVHRFWTILGGILGGFIVLEHLFQGFDLGHPVQAELLEIPSQGVHQAALVAIELA